MTGKLELTPGFYPVAICWGSEEGILPDGLYFNGMHFIDDSGFEARGTLAFRPERFDTKHEAEDKARECDMEDSSEGWIYIP